LTTRHLAHKASFVIFWCTVHHVTVKYILIAAEVIIKSSSVWIHWNYFTLSCTSTLRCHFNKQILKL
jgi:hypothetical protein